MKQEAVPRDERETGNIHSLILYFSCDINNDHFYIFHVYKRRLNRQKQKHPHMRVFSGNAGNGRPPWQPAVSLASQLKKRLPKLLRASLNKAQLK